MNRRQFIQLSLLSASMPLALNGCTVSEVRRSVSAGRNLINGNYSSAIANQVPGIGIPEIDSLMRQGLKKFLDEVAETWQDNKVPTQDTYVKYTDHYQSRAIINFETGVIQIETVVQKNSKAVLKKAIVQTLLTPEDPSSIDLYSAKAPQIGQTPFLIDLVRDQDKQPIRYAWRAERFADYLLRHHYRLYTLKGKQRYAVKFKMVPDFKQKQGQHYRYFVQQQAKRFKIEAALIYGIIETESSFNPYAVSSAPAYGLMQIVPQTAGRDVYRYLNQRDGIPSKTQLFSAATNIQYGSAYLHLLFNRYLKGIHNRQSHEYCVIAAYNTGSGNVLRSFDKDRGRAISKINRMSSQQVYAHLRKHLSSDEARNYLQKVTRNKRKYLTA